MKLSSKIGLTLAELLLAAAILAFALSSLLAVFLSCFFLNAANRNLTIASSHTQYVMEEIKNESSLQAIRDKISSEGVWDTAKISSEGLQALPDEVITVCCCNSLCTGTNPCISCPSGNILGINITVAWKDRGLRDRNLSLVTLMAER